MTFHLGQPRKLHHLISVEAINQVDQSIAELELGRPIQCSENICTKKRTLDCFCTFGLEMLLQSGSMDSIIDLKSNNAYL